MMTALLILHGLLAAALLGAVTHQAVAAGARRPEARSASFFGRFRATDPASYSAAIILLFVLVTVLGALLYPRYRLIVRPLVQSLDLRAANGSFEIKEHLSAIAILMLPAYWACWKQPLALEYESARLWLTRILALTVWWNFVVGQLLVAIKGLFP